MMSPLPWEHSKTVRYAWIFPVRPSDTKSREFLPFGCWRAAERVCPWGTTTFDTSRRCALESCCSRFILWGGKCLNVRDTHHRGGIILGSLPQPSHEESADMLPPAVIQPRNPMQTPYQQSRFCPFSEGQAMLCRQRSPGTSSVWKWKACLSFYMVPAGSCCAVPWGRRASHARELRAFPAISSPAIHALEGSIKRTLK